MYTVGTLSQNHKNLIEVKTADEAFDAYNDDVAMIREDREAYPEKITVVVLGPNGQGLIAVHRFNEYVPEDSQEEDVE